MEVKRRKPKTKLKEYALYKGDEFVLIGSVNQLSAYTGIPATTIRFWSSKKWHEKRKTNNSYIVIGTEDNDE